MNNLDEIIKCRILIESYRNGLIDSDNLYSSIGSLEPLITSVEMTELRKAIFDSVENMERIKFTKDDLRGQYLEILTRLNSSIEKVAPGMKVYFVDNIPACLPITHLINEIEKRGGEIIEHELSDQHFKELRFKVALSREKINTIPLIEGIIRDGVTLFNCECHWSTVEIILS